MDVSNASSSSGVNAEGVCLIGMHGTRTFLAVRMSPAASRGKNATCCIKPEGAVAQTVTMIRIVARHCNILVDRIYVRLYGVPLNHVNRSAYGALLAIRSIGICRCGRLIVSQLCCASSPVLLIETLKAKPRPDRIFHRSRTLVLNIYFLIATPALNVPFGFACRRYPSRSNTPVRNRRSTM